MFEVNLRGTKFSSSSTAVQHLLENLSKKNQTEILADGSYSLDRNPLIFHYILDFYCEGEFHLPRNICPVQAQKEMEFWMIPMKEIPFCCYETLHDDKQTEYKAIILDEGSSEGKHLFTLERTVYSSSCSLTNIRSKLLHALNHPLESWLGKIWLFIVAVFTAVSITVFLLESSALYRVLRSGHPNNKTYELFGHNKKLLKIMITKTSYEIAFAELLSNTVLIFDFLLRFSISRKKKQFCKRLQNILEFMTEMIIYACGIFD
ncbi:potassium voltage-gated channel protein Shal-like [Ostrea edulis]|uniref:potassium voltage-gated channel protein Shal-like n=1 Tax=Ostrea edulis TaxID=37623 RepID=UPI0024AF0F86|nr:potassium voltage-gated channel protein Shal-like [Ostrea edulis]